MSDNDNQHQEAKVLAHDDRSQPPKNKLIMLLAKKAIEMIGIMQTLAVAGTILSGTAIFTGIILVLISDTRPVGYTVLIIGVSTIIICIIHVALLPVLKHFVICDQTEKNRYGKISCGKDLYEKN